MPGRCGPVCLTAETQWGPHCETTQTATILILNGRMPVVRPTRTVVLQLRYTTTYHYSTYNTYTLDDSGMVVLPSILLAYSPSAVEDLSSLLKH